MSHLENLGRRNTDGSIVWEQRRATPNHNIPPAAEPLWVYEPEDGMFPAYPVGILVTHRAQRFTSDTFVAGMRPINDAAKRAWEGFTRKAAGA